MRPCGHVFLNLQHYTHPYITELKASDGKIYVSAIFDCYDLLAAGLAMDTNMKAGLCVKTIDNAVKAHSKLKGVIIHSDRGGQYTSDDYRRKIAKSGLQQSMNSAGGRCHDNARCESMWARMKVELFYSRNDKSENYTVEELKTKVWRYFISYWNNRRICSANGGLPPAFKRYLFIMLRLTLLLLRDFLKFVLRIIDKIIILANRHK